MIRKITDRRILTAALASVAAGLALETSSWAAETNGPVVFETGFAEAPDIGIANADGTDARYGFITNGTNRDPVISASGEVLAFTSTRTGNEEVFRADIDGGNQVNLTNSPARDNDPDWSSDGRVALTSTRAGSSHVFVMGADGSGVRQITRGPGADQQPSWSPDGTEIAFASTRGGPLDLYVVTVATGAVRRLTADATPQADPSWGPTGLIAYTDGAFGGQQIFTIAPTGGTPRRLSRAGYYHHFPSWSPDGARLVFNAGFHLYVMSAETGELISTGPTGSRDAKWGRLPKPDSPPVAGDTFVVKEVGDASARVRPGDANAGGVLPVVVRDPVETPNRLGVRVDGTVTVQASTPQPGSDVTTWRLSNGEFSVRQRGRGAPQVVIDYDYRAQCGGRATAARKDGKKSKAKANGKGKAKGHSGKGSASSTIWSVTETCRGTVFRVSEGQIRVKPKGKPPFTLRAPGRYLARR